MKYWRYLRFLPHGRLVYALLYLPPHEAVRVFRVGMTTTDRDAWVVVVVVVVWC